MEKHSEKAGKMVVVTAPTSYFMVTCPMNHGPNGPNGPTVGFLGTSWEPRFQTAKQSNFLVLLLLPVDGLKGNHFSEAMILPEDTEW